MVFSSFEASSSSSTSSSGSSTLIDFNKVDFESSSIDDSLSIPSVEVLRTIIMLDDDAPGSIQIGSKIIQNIMDIDNLSFSSDHTVYSDCHGDDEASLSKDPWFIAVNNCGRKW